MGLGQHKTQWGFIKLYVIRDKVVVVLAVAAAAAAAVVVIVVIVVQRWVGRGGGRVDFAKA